MLQYVLVAASVLAHMPLESGSMQHTWQLDLGSLEAKP